jgi:hypothetical protein
MTVWYSRGATSSHWILWLKPPYFRGSLLYSFLVKCAGACAACCWFRFCVVVDDEEVDEAVDDENDDVDDNVDDDVACCVDELDELDDKDDDADWDVDDDADDDVACDPVIGSAS